jgi:hypothetical protein
MNIELHEHLMRVTVDPFKKETDKLKATAIYWESRCRASEDAVASMRTALRTNGFEQTLTGEWKPPLGKRPDFEGAVLIAAAVASADAQQTLIDCRRQLIDAAYTYTHRGLANE